ncbi:MAG TPA: DedA family protein/thiosulfate sulfurtransferase GlpE [Nitrospira sp.]|nr:DedA family protein/thiosulfate sulfurtransferase GlpE [Nitrospira sp.]
MHETLEFLTQHGLLVLTAVVFAEQIGLPLPALPFLIAAGALVGTGQMALGLAVVSAVVAAMAGDQVWFELGRRRGRSVLNWLCRISLEPTSCVRRTEDLFSKHGVRALIVAKFVPGFSTIAPPLAGIVGLSVAQFLLFNGLGTLLWVGTGVALGLVFSDQLEQALVMSAQIGPTVGLLVSLTVLAFVGYKALHRYRNDRLPRITARQLTEKLAAGERPVIVDLRPVGAREEEPGIPGAIALTLDELVTTQTELPRDRDVILYCACPQDASSVEGAKRLRERGYTRMWPLAGGLGAWKAASTDVDRSLSVSDHRIVPARMNPVPVTTQS